MVYHMSILFNALTSSLIYVRYSQNLPRLDEAFHSLVAERSFFLLKFGSAFHPQHLFKLFKMQQEMLERVEQERNLAAAVEGNLQRVSASLVATMVRAPD